ncbi:hypothetical protein BDZ45DRAFT_208212 [Acephala macrosclerotiorum]|nr:hypothetical protein BDZ45DRAFT_208212 [Acephala macrosclerotiorum]
MRLVCLKIEAANPKSRRSLFQLVFILEVATCRHLQRRRIMNLEVQNISDHSKIGFSPMLTAFPSMQEIEGAVHIIAQSSGQASPLHGKSRQRLDSSHRVKLAPRHRARGIKRVRGCKYQPTPSITATADLKNIASHVCSLSSRCSVN